MGNIITFGPLFIIIASLIWSADGLLRVNLYSLPPAVVVFYEHIFGLIVMLFAYKWWQADFKKMSRKDWLVVSIIGLFAGALGTIFYTAALGMVQYLQYSVVVLLQQLEPIFAIAIAAVLLKEKITKRFLFWAIVALIAAYMITFKDLVVNFTTGRGTITAALLALGAAAMWGSATSFGRYVLKDITFIGATTFRYMTAAVSSFLILMILQQQAALTTLTQSQVITLIAITFSTGVVAMLIYYYGLKRTPARIATICELSWPASAIFIDYFYFGRSLSFTQLLGVVILSICIYQVTKEKRIEAKQRKS